jgi:cell division protein FtsB
MRGLTWVLLALLLLLQYPLWLGKGSWLKVFDLDRQLSEQRAANRALADRNAKLAAEVNDLKSGYAAIEARARYELGMIRGDEVFFQVMEPAGVARMVVPPPRSVGPGRPPGGASQSMGGPAIDPAGGEGDR